MECLLQEVLRKEPCNGDQDEQAGGGGGSDEADDAKACPGGDAKPSIEMEADRASDDHVGADGASEGEGEEGDEEDVAVGELLAGMAEREQIVEREEAEAREHQSDAAGDGEGRRVTDRVQNLREGEVMRKL